MKKGCAIANVIENRLKYAKVKVDGPMHIDPVVAALEARDSISSSLDKVNYLPLEDAMTLHDMLSTSVLPEAMQQTLMSKIDEKVNSTGASYIGFYGR